MNERNDYESGLRRKKNNWILDDLHYKDEFNPDLSVVGLKC
jgi:hypothetical protein